MLGVSGSGGLTAPITAFTKSWVNALKSFTCLSGSGGFTSNIVVTSS